MPGRFPLAAVPSLLTVLIALSQVGPGPAFASDWPEWRGPNRNGAAPTSPPLISALPTLGLKPAWKSENLPSGGWGSPIVADGRVYLFVHYRSQKTPGE